VRLAAVQFIAIQGLKPEDDRDDLGLAILSRYSRSLPAPFVMVRSARIICISARTWSGVFIAVFHLTAGRPCTG
jgi:hypothetical protein